MSVIRYTPKASDLPDPARRQGGSYSEIEVPGDYEILLKSYDDYDNTHKNGTKGWVFHYACETPSGGSVTFDVWLPFSQMWKVIQHFDALGDVSVDDESREYNPETVVGNMAAAHIDFPRDGTGQPSSKYREIRFVFPIPQRPDAPEVVEASVPEAVDLPDEVEEL